MMPGAVGRRPLAAGLLVLALALTGCAASDSTGAAAPSAAPVPYPGVTTPAPPPPPAPAAAFPAYAVTAKPATLAVYSAPNGSVQRTLDNPVESGAPLTFLLEHQEGEWLNVFLPVRPNGSTGWVRLDQVVLAGVPYRLDVLRAEHQVKLYDQGKLTATYPIGVGTGNTPTPGGTFYLKELLAPTNPGGDYGPYAYGLSGFSTTLQTFNGGDAVIGLHGTNDPTSVGSDVSHGCIRLHNEDITALAKLLPLGTPVRILA